jgi:NADH-quinone oxidoreductase subunit N
MNWYEVVKAMLPEHLLLAGMVVLLTLEILRGRPRDGFVVAFMALAAAAAAAFMLHMEGYAGAPFNGHFSVGPDASPLPAR